MKLLAAILLFCSIQSAMAFDWVSYEIPGAKCADGKPFSVFVQKKASDKLLVEFMGGGVCFDEYSCFKPGGIFPFLYPIPVLESYSIFTSNRSELNPFKSHSKIYFQYCTADVHVGNHIAHYGDHTVYHYGGRNFELAMKYLVEKKIVNFKAVDDLVVFGASAGAIASLVYGKKIEALTPNATKKTLIADSPGLHFGKTFWNKFDSDYKKDFQKTFSEAGLDVDFSDGAVSKRMHPVLARYNDWTVGILIALEDFAMSKFFGDTTPEEHKKLVLSHDGLPYVARDLANVHFWTKDTKMHTFFLTKYTAEMESESSNRSAVQFLDEL